MFTAQLGFRVGVDRIDIVLRMRATAVIDLVGGDLNQPDSGISHRMDDIVDRTGVDALGQLRIGFAFVDIGRGDQIDNKLRLYLCNGEP